MSASRPEVDIDPQETREWLEALEAVFAHDGPERVRFLLERLQTTARQNGAAGAPAGGLATAYRNTLPADGQPKRPGDPKLDKRIEDLLRWNAMVMVVRANKENEGLGGHISTFASVATLFETGFQHFWRAPTDEHRGDLVYFQGHSSPGIYARAFLEGRLTEDQLGRFRRDVDPGGISSYPHPWLMGDFWQFATVSMGLGPLLAIYQARFAKYLHKRGLIDLGVVPHGRKVWAFLGDGETDEPESLGALAIAAREKLDNLIFVVNCNLQRLDGPVRGNGKIIQELEGIFRGAGWNVVKVIWSRHWDRLFAADEDGRLERFLAERVDGEYQAFAANDAAWRRKEFFGQDEEIARRVKDWSDEELAELTFGGHDLERVYAAFAAAVTHQGRPTVILAKTIKGYGLGASAQGRNPTHQLKKLEPDEVAQLRHRLNVALSEEEAHALHFYRPADDSPEMKYLRQRREALGGSLPARRTEAPALETPELSAFEILLKGSGERDQSTTQAFVQILRLLSRDKELRPHLVPIVADEARTFGMEGLFKQLGIYAPSGQLYEPVDAGQLMAYHEAEDGQILQEGITEAGSLASWAAAGTAYANHGLPMIPFFIFYSMFGFQRVADLVWAAADMQARGFLLGATSGRTTLNGEGLQHADGHSHLIAATVPSCRAYDPTFSYEVAVIFQDGLRRMFKEQEKVFYYVTLLNENYPHPALPEGAEEGILRGMYRLRPGKARRKLKVRLLGCGSILREVLAAAEMLEEDFQASAEVWSVTSFTELRRDGLTCDRWNRLHPEDEPRRPYVAEQLAGGSGPVIAATDYMKAFPDQIRAWVEAPYSVLGTDGFGRSDTREDLRRFFEVDRRHVVVAALKALADAGELPAKKVSDAIERLGIDPEAPQPTTV